jgi:hypothetical protein|tara:strand:+ start:404 stop:598 length:195 start_codon:yes stop_codon:yes gene_type:complete
MRYAKSNYSAYTSLAKTDAVSRPANIRDLIKRNKTEEKKDKLLKIYTLLGLSALLILLVLFILA